MMMRRMAPELFKRGVRAAAGRGCRGGGVVQSRPATQLPSPPSTRRRRRAEESVATAIAIRSAARRPRDCSGCGASSSVDSASRGDGWAPWWMPSRRCASSGVGNVARDDDAPSCSAARRPFSSESSTTSSSSSSSESPVPPVVATPPRCVTPSGNAPALSLVPPSTMESLRSLPECSSVLDLISGEEVGEQRCDDDPNVAFNEARSNLERARDILHVAMPDAALATHLIESELLQLRGEFDGALDCLSRHRHLRRRMMSGAGASSTAGGGGGEEQGGSSRSMQFARAKLLVHSGEFDRALSEYEDLLEGMEEDAERQVRLQMRRQRQGQGQREGNNAQQQRRDDDEDPLPAMHGASALTGVGVTKLLLHCRGIRQPSSSSSVSNSSDEEGEIVECLETAVEMLVESRREALRANRHEQYRLAVDLGLAAAVSMTNLGVAHRLLFDDADRSVACWRRGLEALDEALRDAAMNYAVIPRHQFLRMESVRARLHCNVSWSLLGLGSVNSQEVGGGAPYGVVSEEALREASDAAKKALDITDYLINGPRATPDDGDDETGEEEGDAPSAKEWERVLKAKSKEWEEAEADDNDHGGGDSTTNKPDESPPPRLWIEYHRAESARALGLAARCYASAGSAVTAEGLFQSALDASSSYPLGQRLARPPSEGGGAVVRGSKAPGKGVSLSSPHLGLIARDVRLWYAMLCDNWEKRKGDADRLRLDAHRIEDEGVLRGYARSGDADVITSVSGLESSLWLYGPTDFES